MSRRRLRWAWRHVEAPAEVAWDVLASTGRWVDWGPSVTAVDPPDARVDVGLHGRVRTPVGLWIPFEITEVRPGRSWGWEVVGIPATDHAVEPTGPSMCRVGMGVPVLAVPYLVVCRIALGRIAIIAEADDRPEPDR